MVEIFENVFVEESAFESLKWELDLESLEELEARRQWESEMISWLATPEAKEDVNYSDIFKDVYGVRPRW